MMALSTFAVVALPLYIMTNTRDKTKATVPALKRRKTPGATSFSIPTTVARHPCLQFLLSPSEDQYQHLKERPLGLGHRIDQKALQVVYLAYRVQALIDTTSWDWFFTIVEPTYAKLTLEFYLTFFLQQAMSRQADPHSSSFRLGGTSRYLSILGFRVAIGLYFEEFISTPELPTLSRDIYHLAPLIWFEIAETVVQYNPSQSKATCLLSALCYIHAILAHTLIGWRESTGVVGMSDTYFLQSMETYHLIDVSYFVALSCRHLFDRSREGPYMIRLARYFRLLSTVKQASTFTV